MEQILVQYWGTLGIGPYCSHDLGVGIQVQKYISPFWKGLYSLIFRNLQTKKVNQANIDLAVNYSEIVV